MLSPRSLLAHIYDTARVEALRQALINGLLEDLADETLVNNQGLARKDPLFTKALALLVLAVLLELAGVR